jgi:hypothetical protein
MSQLPNIFSQLPSVYELSMFLIRHRQLEKLLHRRDQLTSTKHYPITPNPIQFAKQGATRYQNQCGQEFSKPVTKMSKELTNKRWPIYDSTRRLA